MPVLDSAADFCRLVERARHYKVPGSMSGAAYRTHPCFVVRGNLLFVNEWNVNNYSGIYVIPEGVTMTAPAVDIDPAWGCPWPSFNGKRDGGSLLLRVWDTGRWLARGPWEPAIDTMIADLQREIAAASEAENADLAAKAAAANAAKAAKIAAAAAAFGG